MDNLAKESRVFTDEAYTVTLSGIQVALALTLALAWYAFVKKSINWLYPTTGESIGAFLAYAILVTIIFTVYIMIMKRYLKKSPTALYPLF